MDVVRCAAAAAAAVALAGAGVALLLRKELLAQLGFTASAGIAHNKLLAKIGSAKNKPNQQTIVLPRAVQGLMAVRASAARGCCSWLGGHQLTDSRCSQANQGMWLVQLAMVLYHGMFLAAVGASRCPVVCAGLAFGQGERAGGQAGQPPGTTGLQDCRSSSSCALGTTGDLF